MTNFQKQHRLLKPAEFKAVFDKPIKKIHSTHLLIFVGESICPQARLGLAITKKKLKNAVDRNCLKRLVRENFRHVRDDILPIDMVVIVKSGYQREFDIAQEITELFRKIKKMYRIEKV
ncbi:ribonuclease P protein component [Moraxella cuniculi]|uniref:Ribonuclease P protein component n=1 Tax=Moraxella cuniculi TaxID=34061 RepID=A0A448GV53_9GAMM|nr:ribonuclease P protein component [Moraxella cuniculi]VEG12578.1 Ribonuclease P protein component [Moraxella cuniculi]